MRGFGKGLMVFAVITGLLLAYVHERVGMFLVSYQIHDTASQLAARSEELRRLNFEVAQLRSPQYLEARLRQLSLTLTLPKEIQVLKVPAPVLRQPSEPLSFEAPVRNLTDFFGQWIQVAQARTEQ